MSLLTRLATIEDPRRDINRKHDLLDLLFLTVSAVMSGAEGWKDIQEFGDDKSSGRTICTAQAARRVAPRDGRNEKLAWLRRYRPFLNGMPVDDTIARGVRAIDPVQFNRAFIDWVNEVRAASGQEQIALDGKTLRRSHDGEKHTALHSITARGHECGRALAQMKSSGKKNGQAPVMAMPDL